MRKKVALKTLAWFSAAMMLFARTASAQMMPGDFSMDDVHRFLPPIIEQVEFQPPAPGPSDEISFKVKVVSRDLDYMESAKLFITVDDGETWLEYDMEEAEANPWRFHAVVGPFLDANGIGYRVLATDPNGNRALMSGPWRYDEENRSAWFDSLSPFITDTDDDRVLYPGLDIKTVEFGYDAARLVFRITYDGAVDGGSLTPMDANAYALVILNMKLEKNVNNMVKEENLKSGLVWAWAPAAAAFSYPESALIYAKAGNQPGFFEDGFEYEIEDNVIRLWVARDKFINENPAPEMSFLLGTGKVTSVQPFKGGFIDYSNSATVYMADCFIPFGGMTATVPVVELGHGEIFDSPDQPVDDEEYAQLLAVILKNPEDPIAYFNMAEYLDKAGRTELAIKTYLVVIDLNDDMDAHYNLGLIYYNLGRLDEARPHFERYLESDSDSEWAQRAREYLEEIAEP